MFVTLRSILLLGSLGYVSATCAPQGKGIGHQSLPDTPQGFQNDPYYNQIATNASPVPGYETAFTGFNGSFNAKGYLKYTTLSTYDPLACSAKCNATENCGFFNIYFERDPSVAPDAPKCANPPSIVNIKCALWTSAILSDPNGSINSGQYRGKFHVLMAGSNGYTPKQPEPPVVDQSAIVDLADLTGTPTNLASGFIYGIPDTPNQVPSEFYTNMGFQATRAGGSQLPEPSRGWVFGENEFQNCFQSALSNYRTARQYNATFQVLVSDLWGSDGRVGIPMPGDNGNWTSYDAFLTALIQNIESNNMTPGLVYEIWNEPDGGLFWAASQEQFLEMWGRTFARIKSALPQTPIIGPSTVFPATNNYTWLNTFYEFVKPNNSIPDIYSWHEEANLPGPDSSVAGQKAIQAQMGLPDNPICINEYATFPEQQPAGTAWYISQLERNNAAGLRGNWAGYYSLHDYFANLLGKPGAEMVEDQPEGEVSGYWPNSEWLVYQYYHLNMTGQRVRTTASADKIWDTYATFDSTSGFVKILGGIRYQPGNYSITVNNMTSVGLPATGSVSIQTYHFDWANNVFENDGFAPNDQGSSSHAYSGNTLTFSLAASNLTAYAFEFSTK